MPDWMSSIHRKLQSSSTHINIKLFLAKLIVNAEEVFRPYARFWLSVLVQLVTHGARLHYFAVDLVVTMLSWHTVAIPEVSTDYNTRVVGRYVTSPLSTVNIHSHRIVDTKLGNKNVCGDEVSSVAIG